MAKANREIQFVSAKDIKRRLDKLNAPQFSLAFFSNISDPLLSQALAGRKMLSEGAQFAIVETLDFFEAIAERFAPAPVNFGDVGALASLFTEFQKMHSKDEVVGTRTETA